MNHGWSLIMNHSCDINYNHIVNYHSHINHSWLVIKYQLLIIIVVI